MQRIEALISDADGTLVDTAPLIRHGQHEAARTYLEQHGLAANLLPTYDEYERVLNQHVGGSTRQTFERTVKALFEGRTHHIEQVDYDELNDLLNPIQDRIAPEFVGAFDGQLISYGASAMQVSSSPYSRAVALIT